MKKIANKYHESSMRTQRAHPTLSLERIRKIGDGVRGKLKKTNKEKK
jgi:hypothetical protein